MKIVIDGISYNVTYPIGATLTNEGGLNQASVQIRHIGKLDPFTPFTDVEFLGEWWCIAHDNVVRERYIGRATHNITLVEITKRLERVICGAKTFTRPLYTSYTPVPITPTCTRETWMEVDGNLVGDKSKTSVSFEDLYYLPAASGSTVDSEEFEKLCLLSYYTQSFTMPSYSFAEKQGTYGLISTKVYYKTEDGTQTQIAATQKINTLGRVYLSFEYTTRFKFPLSEEQYSYTTDTVTYTIEITEKPVEKAPLSIWEVTERLLLTATPLRDPSDREFYHSVTPIGCINTKSIESPEFSFSNGATLKENLDQIAKHLHAKVKLSKNGGKKEVWFAPLTTNTRAQIKGTLIGEQTSFGGDKYAGRLHINAANLTISNASEGAVAEPSGTSEYARTSSDYPMRTLRCSDSEVRINDTTGEIESVLPIKRIRTLKMCDGQKTWDITAYVREEADYLALSDYTSSSSKAYAIYYRRGEKNIKGLFFKEETALYPALTKPAIVNVYKAAAGSEAIDLGAYQDLLFYVEYEPYMNLHLVSSRTDGKGGSVAYIANQSANETDKDLLSDFARGTIEQMASDAPKKTYLMRSLDMVPKIGTMYDTHSYISEVSFEIYPYFVKCTLSIAEHYNRLGQRVEVPNQIRQYEIDVNNVKDRSVLYTDVCTISYFPSTVEDDSLMVDLGKCFLVDHIVNHGGFGPQSANYSVSVAEVTTYAGEYEKNQLPEFSKARKLQSVLLPVASFGFANTVTFVIPFHDNFSAGGIATPAGSGFNLKDYVPYGDAYGDAEFIRFELRNGMTVDSANRKKIGRSLPLLKDCPFHVFGESLISTSYRSSQHAGIQLFKDGRERIVLSYQILFQSDSDIIIGNNFASNSPIVRDFSEDGLLDEDLQYCENTDAELHLYGDGSDGSNYLHPITGTTSTGGSIVKTTLGYNRSRYICVESDLPPHSAWAILFKGKFMLGANKPFPQDKRIYFNFSHK